MRGADITRAWRQPSLRLPACPLWLMKPEMRPPDSRATRLAPARMPRLLAPDAWPTTIEEASRGQPQRRLINRTGAPQHPEPWLQVTPATTDRPKEPGRARIAIPHPEPGAELSVLDNRDYQCRLPGRSNRAMPWRPSLLIRSCRARDGSGLATSGLPGLRLAIQISVVAAPRGIMKPAAWSDPKKPRSPRSTPIAPKPADAAGAANSVLSTDGVLNTESTAVPSPSAAKGPKRPEVCERLIHWLRSQTQWPTVQWGKGTMSSQAQTNWFTIDEYFALERASERRFEYREGEVVCRSEGTREHAAIARNILRHLANRIPKTCEAYGSDLALYAPAGLPYRYPDASVVCGGARFRTINGLDALENPVLIVEVLSPTSTDFDRGTKFEQYKSIPAFAEYLLVAQDRGHVARRIKRDDGSWNETVFESLSAVIHIDTVGIDLALSEIYEGIPIVGVIQ